MPVRLAVRRRRSDERALLLDGAVGTELVARGLDLAREPPEAWLTTHRDDVRAVHVAYVAAGSDAIQTNTFGASAPRLARAGLPHTDADVADLNRRAVAVAREAAAGRAAVVASVGPTGIDPFSADARARITAAYVVQLAALAEAGVDALHLETMYHPVEAEAAVAACREVAPRLPVVVSSTYALGDHGYQTPLGVPLAAMLRACEAAGPDGLGVNCSLEARRMVGLVGRLRELTELPLWVQPQGAPTDADCRAPRRSDEVVLFARHAVELVHAGADAVGGCCGAGPLHVRALVDALGPERLQRPPLASTSGA